MRPFIAEIIDLRLIEMGRKVRDPETGYLKDCFEKTCQFGAFDILDDKVIRIDVRIEIQDKEKYFKVE